MGYIFTKIVPNKMNISDNLYIDLGDRGNLKIEETYDDGAGGHANCSNRAIGGWDGEMFGGGEGGCGNDAKNTHGASNINPGGNGYPQNGGDGFGGKGGKGNGKCGTCSCGGPGGGNGGSNKNCTSYITVV